MSPARRKHIRWTLNNRQGGKCCYCHCRLRMPKGLRFKNEAQAFHPQAATLEHLRRKCDGGTNHPDNLALACRRCNTARGELSWVEFATLMRPEAA